MPLKAVSEYRTQISLLQLCMCVTAKMKFQGEGEYPCAPPPPEGNPASFL